MNVDNDKMIHLMYRIQFVSVIEGEHLQIVYVYSIDIPLP